MHWHFINLMPTSSGYQAISCRIILLFQCATLSIYSKANRRCQLPGNSPCNFKTASYSNTQNRSRFEFHTSLWFKLFTSFHIFLQIIWYSCLYHYLLTLLTNKTNAALSRGWSSEQNSKRKAVLHIEPRAKMSGAWPPLNMCFHSTLCRHSGNFSKCQEWLLLVCCSCGFSELQPWRWWQYDSLERSYVPVYKATKTQNIAVLTALRVSEFKNLTPFYFTAGI
jgi:hypothetical protein